METFLSAVAGSAVVATLFGLWIRSYFGEYLAQKAKNLATHEDIQKLVDQVRETERVKAEISDRVWDRQRRWDMKKEMYVDAYAAVHKLADRLATIAQLKRAEVRQEVADAAVLRTALDEMRRDLDQLGRVSFAAPLFLSDAASKSLWRISEVISTFMAIVSKDDSGMTDRDMDIVERELAIRINPAILEFAAHAREDIGYTGAAAVTQSGS